MIKYKDLLSMSKKQFYSFASCEFDDDFGCRPVKFESDEQIIEWFKAGLNNPDRMNEYSIEEVKQELWEHMFLEKYPFDGNEYIPCLATYNAREEEKNVPFFEKNLPLLGDESKVYPSLRRIVYQQRELKFAENSFSNDHPNPIVLSVRELRISFDDYINKIFLEQTRLTKAVVNLSSPD